MKTTLSFTAFVSLLIISTSSLYAQKEANRWYFGHGAGIDFSSGIAVPVTNGAQSVTENSSSICDKSTGDLLMYTDGDTVWNKNHLPMANGMGLKGGNSCFQGVLIVPLPQNDSLYYIFTAPDYESADICLTYSIVNIKANLGLGDVINKNIPLLPLVEVTEKITATYHANGIDIWIVTHEWNSNRYIAHLLTANGIINTVYSNVGYVIVPSFGTNDNSKIGGMKISPNGKKIASTVFVSKVIEVCDFNNCTGIVSNPLTKSGGSLKGGIEFSPDNSRIYVTEMGNVVQYNVLAGAGIFTAAIVVLAATPPINYYFGIQLGPDNKIYIARVISNTGPLTDDIAVIKNPNNLGLASNATDMGLYLNGKKCWEGMPNIFRAFYTITPLNITMSNDTSICKGQQVQLHINGGTRYYWSPALGLSNDTINNPVANPKTTTTYRIIVSSGCAFDTASITVNIAKSGSAAITVTSGLNCSTDNNAIVTVSMAGGTPNYMYSWSNGQTTQLATSLSQGNYTVTVTDTNGCTATSSATISSPPPLVGQFTKGTANCTNCGCKEWILVTATGSTGPYSYTWLDGYVNRYKNQLCPGTYTIKIKDKNGCSVNVNLSAP
ncbi:MAG: SprB repeat-containing protein [Bacteroidetes bacterium]|nr:SprB repeat-containing protein [Bacteroidota bacterium]